ncbi:MAG: hypothetical protein NTY98_04285 [Verrucomicrobia bacterium]|nr:hypothetical protein [Verrucomicrobiota bacterium]
MSALLWLLVTALAPFALLIGSMGLRRKFAGSTFIIRSLRFATLASLAALLLLALEISAVGWDAFYNMHDRSCFDEQFPTSIFRAAANAVVLLLSWSVTRAMAHNNPGIR